MFKSRLRPIVFPQSEHLRLAGTLALLWGNAEFDRPDIELTSLVAGIGLHDRGYGQLDNLAIGELAEAPWLEVTRRGFYMPGTDPVADLITKLHLRRLVSGGDSAGRRALLAEMEAAIDAEVEHHGLSRAALERIDRVTRFCDTVAFHFCFEQATNGAVDVFPRSGDDRTVGVHFAVESGQIAVEPWPFGVDAYAGYVLAYRLEGYPDVLDPVVVPYRLSRE